MAISQFVELGKDKISTVLEKLCLNGSMENVKRNCIHNDAKPRRLMGRQGPTENG